MSATGENQHHGHEHPDEEEQEVILRKRKQQEYEDAVRQQAAQHEAARREEQERSLKETANKQFHEPRSHMKVDCGGGVANYGNEITVRFSKSQRAPGNEQLQLALKQAIATGWTELYVYKGDGQTPDLQLAGRLRAMAFQMGIPENQLRICDAPGDYSLRAQWKQTHPSQPQGAKPLEHVPVHKMGNVSDTQPVAMPA